MWDSTETWGAITFQEVVGDNAQSEPGVARLLRGCGKSGDALVLSPPSTRTAPSCSCCTSPPCPLYLCSYVCPEWSCSFCFLGPRAQNSDRILPPTIIDWTFLRGVPAARHGYVRVATGPPPKSHHVRNRRERENVRHGDKHMWEGAMASRTTARPQSRRAEQLRGAALRPDRPRQALHEHLCILVDFRLLPGGRLIISHILARPYLWQHRSEIHRLHIGR